MMSAARVSQRSVSEKLALAGGAATIALVSGTTADAGIVAAQNLPSVFWVGNAPWDIDGNGSTEFEAQALTSKYTTSNTGNVLTIRGALFIEQTAGRFVVPTSSNVGIAKLAAGFEVKSTMSGNEFNFVAPQTYNVVTYQGDAQFASRGWAAPGTGFFGFTFYDGFNTYFGWGELSLHGGANGGGFSVLQAYYNDTPGASIKVGDTGAVVIPEPSTCALALLAAGGVAAYRSRRKVAAA